MSSLTTNALCSIAATTRFRCRRRSQKHETRVRHLHWAWSCRDLQKVLQAVRLFAPYIPRKMASQAISYKQRSFLAIVDTLGQCVEYFTRRKDCTENMECIRQSKLMLLGSFPMGAQKTCLNYFFRLEKTLWLRLSINALLTLYNSMDPPPPPPSSTPSVWTRSSGNPCRQCRTRYTWHDWLDRLQ